MKAEVTIVSDADCAAGSGLEQCNSNPDTLSYAGKITSQMLCASATGVDKQVDGVERKPFREGCLPR